MTHRDVLQAYRAASGNIDALMDLIAEDAVYFFSNESVHDGKPAVRAAIEHNAQAIEDDTYDISNVRWLVESADAAVCLYDYAWTGRMNGQAVSGSGRGTTVLRREQDGWKIVHEHLSHGVFSA